MKLHPLLHWGEEFPRVDDYDGREALRRTQMVPVVPLAVVETRAHRLMRYMGGELSSIQGSQMKGAGLPYRTEIFVHEWAHMLLLDKGDAPECLEDQYMRMAIAALRVPDVWDVRGSARAQNENEVETTAVTSLVLELLGLDYDRWSLVSSASLNLRGKVWTCQEVYPQVRAARERENVNKVAMKIVARLLKVREDQLER